MAVKKTSEEPYQARAFCGLPDEPARHFDHNIHPGRAAAILDNDRKWVSGTTLHYYFFDSDEFDWDSNRFPVGGDAAQKRIVRDAFAEWSALKIGLEFVEVNNVAESEIRIGFVHGDGSWSWLGRRILDEPLTARTMNFGWDLTDEIDTAIHEIGHTMGMPHEHQNPYAGIVWDEDAVYADLAAPPNSWSHQKTFNNILRKLPEDSVSGSSWDKNSIMHYPFKAGMILSPTRYRTQPLVPDAGLSPADKRTVKEWYPRVQARPPILGPFESQRVSIAPGEQVSFRIEPDASRTYNIRTFGEADTVMILFEDVDGELRYVAGNDDSGTDLNALIEQKLFSDRKYVVRLRLYWAGESGDFGVVLY